MESVVEDTFWPSATKFQRLALEYVSKSKITNKI